MKRTASILPAMALGVAASLLGVQSALALEGRWQGTLNAGPANLRLVLEVIMTEDRIYLGTLTSVDQGNAVLPIDVIEVNDDGVRFEVRTVGARYDGRLDETRSRLAGTWTQGAPLPLEFERTAGAAETRRAESARTGEGRAAAAPEPFGLPLQVEVAGAPAPFAAGGSFHLAYELHLTNFGANQLSVRRIEVRAADAADEELAIATLEGAELNGALRPVGAPPPGASPDERIADRRDIPPGRRAVAFVWTTFDDAAAVPAALVHRITAAGQTIDGAGTPISQEGPPVLGPPLRGAGWMAVNGPGNASIHRRALLPTSGRASIAQRFAIDWVRLDAASRTFSGDPEDNRAYYAYGEEILAVADGVVAAIEDGIPENVPGLMSRAVPITRETIAGNYIVLDVGSGRYAFYAHLQPGSLRVQPGDSVQRGDVIALVGNSGNSTEPHLHFHLADGLGALSSEGLPYVIDAFAVADADGTLVPRRSELPMQNALVQFPDKP